MRLDRCWRGHFISMTLWVVPWPVVTWGIFIVVLCLWVTVEILVLWRYFVVLRDGIDFIWIRELWCGGCRSIMRCVGVVSVVLCMWGHVSCALQLGCTYVNNPLWARVDVRLRVVNLVHLSHCWITTNIWKLYLPWIMDASLRSYVNSEYTH